VTQDLSGRVVSIVAQVLPRSITSLVWPLIGWNIDREDMSKIFWIVYDISSISLIDAFLCYLEFSRNSIIKLTRHDVNRSSLDIGEVVDLSSALVFSCFVKATFDNGFDIYIMAQGTIKEVILGPIGSTLHQTNSFDGVRHNDVKLV
jgi:hypothetical protein